MAITINTTQYETAHGHRPRGQKVWIFEFNLKTKDSENSEPIRIGLSGLYQDAEKEAKRLISLKYPHQDITIHVLPSFDFSKSERNRLFNRPKRGRSSIPIQKPRPPTGEYPGEG